MRKPSTLVILTVFFVLASAGPLLATSNPALRNAPEEAVKGVISIGVPFTGDRAGGPDGYGYTYLDSTDAGGPAYSFQDISGTGTPYLLSDDDSAPVAIGFTFNFYGAAYSSVELGSNGYLSFGPDPTDFSNDCPLLEDGTTPPLSIFAYWDDLDPGDDLASAYSQQFATCPYVPSGGTATACTILQWEEFDLFPGDGVPGGSAGTFQAILYDDDTILLQYEGGPGLDGAFATVGIWEDTIVNSLLYTCDGGGISGGFAILFGQGEVGDLEIIKSGAVGIGGPFDYTITVNNLGPDPQTGVVVTDVLPAELTYVSNDCGGTMAAGTWTWNIGFLDSPDSAVCNLTVQLAGADCVAVSNTATVTGDLVDPVGNSTSTVSNGGGNVVADPSFEGGTPNSDWIEASSTFGTPLCTEASCGLGTGTGPRTGDWWTWFGGTAAYEEGSMTQDVFIGSGATNLTFWFEAIICDSAADYVEVTIDGTQVGFWDGASPFCGTLGYHQETVDISAFADGSTHTLEFHSEIFGNNGAGSNFFIDDVALDSAPTCEDVQPPPPTEAIPDLNHIGMAVLVLLLGLGGAVLLRHWYHA